MKAVAAHTRSENAIAAIALVRSAALLVVLGSLAACSSYHPRSPTPTPFPRDQVTVQPEGSVLGDYTLTSPPAWRIEERRNGQVVVLVPPTGKGRLRIIALANPEPPPGLSRAYAEVVAARALLEVRLQANIGAVRSLSDDQMLVLSDGAAGGTTVVEAVHVFRTGRVVVAFFRAPSRDVHFATAKRIMKGLRMKPSA